MAWSYNGKGWTTFYKKCRSIDFDNRPQGVQLIVINSEGSKLIYLTFFFKNKEDYENIRIRLAHFSHPNRLKYFDNDITIKGFLGDTVLRQFLILVNPLLKEPIPKPIFNDLLSACSLEPLPQPKSLFNLCRGYIKHRYDQYAPYINILPDEIKKSLTAVEENEQDFKRKRIDCSTDKTNFDPSRPRLIKRLTPSI